MGDGSPLKPATRSMTDDHGNVSSMRLMFLLALFVAASLAAGEAFGWGSCESNTELVLYFLVAVIGEVKWMARTL